MKIAREMSKDGIIYQKMTPEEWKTYADFHYPHYLESSWNGLGDPLNDDWLRLYITTSIENEIVDDFKIFFTKAIHV